ncbi:MAG: hypothetical protein J6Y28_01650 [Acholeplasmatales bacterium]|nr:hypothetical protein [Methanobrevibacter sp.]MBP5444852.1 hypothetical protein [Acholeplasmatales bacterium]
MNKTFFTGFTFKPVINKRKNTNKTSFKELVYCVCIEEKPHTFIAYVNPKENVKFLKNYKIPFTNKSYSLLGRVKVFDVRKTKSKKPIIYIRDKYDAIHHPGTSAEYTPFCHNYVYSGYIIRYDDGYKFDIVEVIDYIDRCKHLVSNIDFNDK